MLQNILYQKYQFCELLHDVSVAAWDKSQHKIIFYFNQEFQLPNCSYLLVLFLCKYIRAQNTFQVYSKNPVSHHQFHLMYRLLKISHGRQEMTLKLYTSQQSMSTTPKFCQFSETFSWWCGQWQ